MTALTTVLPPDAQPEILLLVSLLADYSLDNRLLNHFLIIWMPQMSQVLH